MLAIPAQDHGDVPSNHARHVRAHGPNTGEGVEAFRAYEDAVLPLLPEFNGCLDHRLRNRDGTMEIQIVSFASDADFQDYRNDPRRAAQAGLLEKSSAKLDLLPMADVLHSSPTRLPRPMFQSRQSAARNFTCAAGQIARTFSGIPPRRGGTFRPVGCGMNVVAALLGQERKHCLAH